MYACDWYHLSLIDIFLVTSNRVYTHYVLLYFRDRRVLAVIALNILIYGAFYGVFQGVELHWYLVGMEIAIQSATKRDPGKSAAELSESSARGWPQDFPFQLSKEVPG